MGYRSNDVDDGDITAVVHIVGCHRCGCRCSGGELLVRAEHDLGDATRLVGTLAFEGEFHRALNSAGDVGDVEKFDAEPDVGANLHW